MNARLTIENVTKVYSTRFQKTTALNNVSFTVNKGEFIGIMGPSGAGKSTLLNVISTIDKPTSGNIAFDQESIINMKGNTLADFRRDNLGFIFQDFNLLDTLTVEENILLPLAIKNQSVNSIQQRVFDIASFLEIDDILKKYPYEISGGQKQRTAAARACIHEPKLILADEPTGALDSKSSTELLTRLTQLNQQLDTTILLVTHDPYAASYCDRILFINDGEIFTEIAKSSSRKEFYNRIIDVLGRLGGGLHDIL